MLSLRLPGYPGRVLSGLDVSDESSLPRHAPLVLRRDPSSYTYYARVDGGFGWRITEAWAQAKPSGPDDEISNVSFLFASGWPVVALFGERDLWEIAERHSGRTDGLRSWSEVVPRRPLLVGFILDSVFYASLLWLAYSIPKWWLRRRRRARGACESCGYALTAGGSIRCPECGTVRRVNG